MTKQHKKNKQNEQNKKLSKRQEWLKKKEAMCEKLIRSEMPSPKISPKGLGSLVGGFIAILMAMETLKVATNSLNGIKEGKNG